MSFTDFTNEVLSTPLPDFLIAAAAVSATSSPTVVFPIAILSYFLTFISATALPVTITSIFPF